MSISEDFQALSAKQAQLLALLDQLGRSGDAQSRLFADGVRRRLADLRAIGADGNPLQLAMRLLDLVPTPKDADAIGFDISKHPDVAALRNHIEVTAARLAGPLIDAS